MPHLKRLAVADGVFLNVIQTDKFKTNALTLYFISKLDRAAAPLNALLPYVLKRGCLKYPTLIDVNRRLESLYGANLSVKVRKKGENHIFGLGIEFLDRRYALAGENTAAECVSLLFDIIAEPLIENDAFYPDYVESEKNNLCDIIEGQINDKRIYAINRLYQEMCRDEAFGTLEYGDVAGVKAIDAFALYRHYKNVIASARIEIFYTGSEDIDYISNLVAERFKTIERKDVAAPITQLIRRAEKPKEVTEKLAVKQGKLALGFRTGVAANDQSFPALTVFNAVYGGAPTSKLFLNVREKLSLCYYCYSRLEKLKGLMIVASGVDFDKRRTAFDEIMNQLDAVKQGNITDEELANAVKVIKNSLRSSADSMNAMEDWYLGETLSKTNRDIESFISDTEKVTAKDVANVANGVTLDTVYFLEGEGAGE